ncbi:MAG: tetratricopeptide repeat protein [Rubellimicrobium sp.]|nr:tetratricopeptide repeat protein [Rubellimicrobium sp.]
MKIARPGFKPILAALLITVGFCVPLSAQEGVALSRLDRLHAELVESEDPLEAQRIVQQIATEWSRSGSPAIDLLLQRGEDALELGDFVTASEHFTAAIDHDPDFAEAWHGRAAAYYHLDLVGPALDDLREVLVLNPRHFNALRGFAVILEELGLAQEAREAYLRVQELHPQDVEAARALQRLDAELDGTAL